MVCIPRPIVLATGLIGLAALWLLAGADPAAAQDAFVAGLREELTVAGERVAEWREFARLSMLLAIAIGVLGVGISTLQRFTGERNLGWLVVTLGGVITALTIVTNTLTPADHRAINASVRKAEGVLRELRLVLNGLPAELTREQRRDVTAQFREGLNRVDGCFEYETAAVGVLGLPTAAHARSDGDLRVVGTARDASLDRARRKAERSARRRAIEVVTGELEQSGVDDAGELARFLVDGADFATPRFEYDERSRTFVYTAPLVVRRDRIHRELNLYQLQEGVALDPELGAELRRRLPAVAAPPR